MFSLSFKKVVLLILVLLMIYVWWNNLSQPEYSESEEQTEQATQSPDGNHHTSALPEITYVPPKYDPFRKYVKPSPVSAASTTKREAKPVALKLVAGHNLSGILSKGKSSQAVVVVPAQGSRVLTLGDSLGSWQLIGIKEMSVIFKNGRNYDTLYLEQSSH